MSKLIEFYLKNGRDSEGRTLEEIMKFSLETMEYCHNYIQWLFPLREPSNYNADAPLLTNEDIKIIKSNPTNLLASLDKFLYFIGLELKDGKIVKAENFQKQKNRVFEGFNHNYLRVTRVLACLSMCGQQDVANNLLEFLLQECYPSENTIKHWKSAVLSV